MKKDIRPDEEVVTRGILRRALLPLKRSDAKLREEMHEMEFRLINRMDERFSKVYERFDRMEKGFDEIREEMKKQTDTFQKLADKVIGEHKNFEVESVSIRHNYNQLEKRVTKVEEVVFPAV